VFLERLGDKGFGLWIVLQGGIEVFLFKMAMNGQLLFELPKQLITLGCFSVFSSFWNRFLTLPWSSLSKLKISIML
jgi:hypothetical protein